MLGDEQAGAGEGAGSTGEFDGELDPELIYGERFFAQYESDTEWTAFFDSVAEKIVRHFEPRTALDVGCGMGHLVAALRRRGVAAVGIDHAAFAVEHAVDGAAGHVRVASATDPIEGTFDLVTCIEVLEHLPRSSAPDAIDNICSVTDRILFSSTSDLRHLADPTHVGMRDAEDWTALFSTCGFYRMLEDDVTWLAPWAMVLERRPVMTSTDLIRAYDRQAARDRREIHELRTTALRLEGELEAATRSGEASSADHARAIAAETELLRVRDQLIATSRELGKARGEVTRLLDQLHHHDAVLRHNELLVDQHRAVIDSTSWKLMWRLLAPYRRLQARRGR